MNPKRTNLIRVIPLFFGLFSLWACAGQSAGNDPRLAEAKRTIGEAYMRQGDYTSALRELVLAEKINPEDPITHNDMGLCYMARERMADAIAHFKKAVALQPSYAPARNNLGTAYLTLKEWDAAIEVFKEITGDVLYANPHHPLANLGLAYYHKGEYLTALKYYKEALKIDENFVNALRGAGRTCLAMNKGRQALDYLTRAVQIAPKAAEIHFELGEAHLLTGNAAQARISYENALELAAPDSEVIQKARKRLETIQ